MDLQVYYQKIREMETKIADEFPLMVSEETADGGKGGTKTEVPRRLAAKLLVEGLARLASKEELKAYRDVLAEAKRVAERAAAAARLQLTVLSTTELDRLRSEARSTKE
jgi:antirestriction protein ArdC